MRVIDEQKYSPASVRLQERRSNGVVYTPPFLAHFIAKKLAEYWLSEQPAVKRNSELSILDPACGEGELLTSLIDALDVPNSVTVRGIDIDRNALKVSASKLRGYGPALKLQFLHANALLSDATSTNIGLDLLIANPPWGADISGYKSQLSAKGYTLNNGQFDSADLFIEYATWAVKPGGYFAFIIPDSLFSHERRALRKLLGARTEIKYVARLGEKIFTGVSRGCALIICKNVAPRESALVECLRLDHSTRRNILRGTETFEHANERLNHFIPHHKFTVSPDFLFPIEAQGSEEIVINKIKLQERVLRDYASSTRGVELSKSGRVSQCTSCSKWSPTPAARNPICRHCLTRIDLLATVTKSIISKDKHKDYEKILVGESIQRYLVTRPYWITTETKGINYKPRETYNSPKVIVRKTGIGITATIDYTNAYTNQVVYMLNTRPGTIASEVVLAILNSRVIFFYLLKKYGEAEWRSHPYLTQSQILSLPVPNMETDSTRKTLAKIEEILKPRLVQNVGIGPEIDAEVERLVAELYGLNYQDYQDIYSALASAEALLPVRALKVISPEAIFQLSEEK